MGSRVITAGHSAESEQMTLDFDPRLHERFGSLRECIAQGIYQRGLSNVAPSLDKAPGNLSVELSESPERKFGVESLEQYIERFGDVQPILYLISKFMRQAPAEVEDPEVIAIAKQIVAMRRGVPA